ncbi:2,3-bisphosphoglycerate-independent phosphoglycerate mutase [Candidatus Uhrbacteria bacterium]|nr:2,3-bisphosphoglycerate-independent phosphoglycerate mutase [Candidatus Uhrbacteria bacterium]MBI4598580.1 2,3-bisphosphoglycerate-independent phosphoglycerate mutase [Candidatus Uhrbacteria bacterium]
MESNLGQRPRPAVLIVLDGFGIAPDSEGNAITRARTPVFKKLIQTYPVMALRASGEEVGLSWGEMGNSEVGHLAIGAGRVYYQTFPRINRDIAAGSFFENPALVQAFEHTKANGKAVHLVGMVSAGRVHSMDEHCHALLELAKRQQFDRVFVHAILDGRDTVYNVGIDFVQTLQAKIAELGVGKIASLSGRYYAMDRDNRWDRIEKAYNAMALGQGEMATDPIAAIQESYAKDVFDEQFVPTVILENGAPVAIVKEGDSVIFFNFRPDRMREIVKAFVLPDFDAFSRQTVHDLFPVTMAEYEKGLPVEVAFPPEAIQKCLAEVLSSAGLRQLHIAETEKYAHVTFFLNGTKENLFPGEDRAIIPSPRVASYDQAPEMSAYELAERVVQEINADAYDFIVMNFANPDMVSHTGDLPASVKAIEAVDACVGKIVDAALRKDGVVFITADHGNAEEVKNLRTGYIDKEHSTNPVPFFVIGKAFEGVPAPSGEVPEGDLSLVPPIGMLADVTPTILNVLGIPQPPEMTGQPLV